VRPFFSTGSEPGILRTTWRELVRRHAREKAAESLPDDERWRSLTWRHFRHRVLRHLAVRGALSVDELVKDPPTVLSMPLDRQELEAVLDSARRRRLVEPLGHPRRPNGDEAPDEWAVTDAGRRAVRRLGPALSGTLKTWVSIAAALVGVFGTTLTLEQVGLSLVEAATLAIPLGIALSVAVHVRALLTGAAPARVVAHDWRRWATERPAQHRDATMFFPFRSLLAMLFVFWASLVALAVIDVVTGVDAVLSPLTAFVPVVLAALAGGRSVFEWIARWPPGVPATDLEELQQHEDVDHEEDREEDRPAVQVALDERAAAERAAAAADAEGAGEAGVLARVQQHEQHDDHRQGDLDEEKDRLHGRVG
jgi:hypothetical protein